jgi:hypothetical protein
VAKFAQNKVKLKGNYQAQVHSDLMVLVVVRQQAGPRLWWPKVLKEGDGKRLQAARGPT